MSFNWIPKSASLSAEYLRHPTDSVIDQIKHRPRTEKLFNPQGHPTCLTPHSNLSFQSINKAQFNPTQSKYTLSFRDPSTASQNATQEPRSYRPRRPRRQCHSYRRSRPCPASSSPRPRYHRRPMPERLRCFVLPERIRIDRKQLPEKHCDCGKRQYRH
jgi:hypothetical protein